ncbi:MAG: hypothetical protein AVDCRST_MAG41-2789, partial [uncultured Corynebacteriales bacterium]
PTTDDRAPSRRRPYVAVVAVILAVAAALLLPFLVDRGDDSAATAPRATPPAAPTTPPPTTEPSAPTAPPAGYTVHRDPSGWTIAVPTGWRITRRGESVTFTDPTGPRSLRVTRRANPPTDPYDEALKLEPVVKAATPGYDFQRIARVTYRGWPTADWEYSAGSRRTLIRSVVPDRRTGYSITWTAPQVSWTEDRKIFATAVGTFTPA